MTDYQGAGARVGGLDGPGVLPDELALWAKEASLEDVKIGAEYLFLPDERTLFTESMKSIESMLIDLEEKYHYDERFLGVGSLTLTGRKLS